jgi:hypothetical protein
MCEIAVPHQSQPQKLAANVELSEAFTPGTNRSCQYCDHRQNPEEKKKKLFRRSESRWEPSHDDERIEGGLVERLVSLKEVR